MSNTKSNWPQVQAPSVSNEEMSATVKNISELRKLPPIDTKDPDAINERIDHFFEYCVKSGLRPTVTLLAAACGVRRETLWKWEQAGDSRGKAIERAKGLLEALTEEWLAAGKISPPSGIFILKNHYGWRDNIEILAARTTPADSLPSTEEIIKRLPETAKDENTKVYGSLEELLDDSEESGGREGGNI